MSQFVKPGPLGLGGYRPVPGGHSDPECTHVILTLWEYDALLDKIRQAEQESRSTKHDAEKTIAQIKRDSEYQVYQAGEKGKKAVRLTNWNPALAVMHGNIRKKRVSIICTSIIKGSRI